MKKGSSHSYERDHTNRHPGGMHGSPRETGKHHGGTEKGAGELTIGMGPGKAALRTKASEDPGFDSSRKGPKTKPYNRGEESDE